MVLMLIILTYRVDHTCKYKAVSYPSTPTPRLHTQQPTIYTFHMVCRTDTLLEREHTHRVTLTENLTFQSTTPPDFRNSTPPAAPRDPCSSPVNRRLPDIIFVYRVSQVEWTKLRESVPYVELYRYNPKHLYPKLNGYGDNGQRSLKV